jgi:arylsulfatase A-like enzyme
MPFIVRWLGQTRGNQVDSTSVLTAFDMLPTFCRLANVKNTPLSKNGDGRDKSTVFKGKKSKEKRTIFWEYGRNETAFKYPEGKDRSPNLAMREGDWKLLTKII